MPVAHSVCYCLAWCATVISVATPPKEKPCSSPETPTARSSQTKSAPSRSSASQAPHTLGVILNTPIDIGNGNQIDTSYAGTEVSDLVQQVERAIQAEKERKQQESRHRRQTEAFWETHPVGSTLHYHHGFGAYVRGIVGRASTGKHVFIPQALVGNWSTIDLPSRDSNGTELVPYMVRQIRETISFTPAISNYFEANTGRLKVDPTALPEIDLSLPELTEAEEKHYALQEALSQIGATATSSGTPEERLARVRELIDRAQELTS